MTHKCEIHWGDCRNILPQFEKESIDLILTSPPYDNLRNYNSTLNWNFEIFSQIAFELNRVLKPGGIIVWIVGDAVIKGSETGTSFKQALYFKEELKLNLHDTMIFKKINKPLTHNRYEQHFEYMFIFSKGKPRVFNPIKDKVNKYFGNKVTATWRNVSGVSFESSGKRNKKTISEFGMRGNIWEYDVGYLKSTLDKIAYKHPASFPEKLAHDHIISWSNENDNVLDPFMGSGTVGKICKNLNRNFIGIDIVEEYINITKERLNYD